jgi:hypothetical protein
MPNPIRAKIYEMYLEAIGVKTPMSYIAEFGVKGSEGIVLVGI